MSRARQLLAAWSSALLVACSSGDDPTTSTGPNLGDRSSSGSDGPGTTAIADGSADTSSGPGPLDGTSTSDGPASTSDGCPLGQEGCSCNAGICDPDLTCIDGACAAAQCSGDVFEPNDSEAEATNLGEITDSDGDGGVVAASLHDAGDVDWYTYFGNDDITGTVDPTRSLVASGGLRLCKFLECANGLAETEFACPSGTQYALSPMARPGCCASEGFALDDFNCTGVIEDNATAYIRIDQPELACVTYSVSYHY